MDFWGGPPQTHLNNPSGYLIPPLNKVYQGRSLKWHFPDFLFRGLHVLAANLLGRLCTLDCMPWQLEVVDFESIGCCQRTTARKAPATSDGGGELARSGPRVGQLSAYNIFPRRFRTVFLLPRACTKSGWLEVDQKFDMGCQLLTRRFPC